MNRCRLDFDCAACQNLRRVKDPEKHRDGLYCIPTIEAEDRVGVGNGTDITIIHADEDFVLRCDQYKPPGEQINLFEEETSDGQ